MNWNDTKLTVKEQKNQFVVVPIALGGGRTLFDDVTRPIPLELLDSRTFKNGNVFSRYKPR